MADQRVAKALDWLKTTRLLERTTPRLDRKRKKKGANKDWTHPHDLDACITKMKDGRTHLAHKAEHAVDLDTGAIVVVTVQSADQGDTTTIDQTLAETVEQLIAVEKPRTSRSNSRAGSWPTRAITAGRRSGNSMTWASAPTSSAHRFLHDRGQAQVSSRYEQRKALFPGSVTHTLRILHQPKRYVHCNRTGREFMRKRTLQEAGAVFTVCIALGLAGGILSGRALHADSDDGDGDEARIGRGFAIAPVPLNLKHKNRALVGLGSYIVNAQAECNGCHSQGPQTQYLPGGNPYFGQREATNPATYLGGGRDFGPYPSPASPIHIISRNLTPDVTGRPIGGDTFEQFRHTIRTGIDPDALHPSLPPPFLGSLLQIMPWPAYQHMSDRDLRAIYEYLSAIPCIAGPGHIC